MAYCDKANGFCSLMDITRKQSERITQLERKIYLINIEILEAIEACCGDELDKAVKILKQVLKGK